MRFFLFILISCFSGVFAGMGMGGGTFLIPLLSLFFGIEQIICQSTNVVCFVVLAAICFVIYIKNKLIDFKSFFCVAVPSTAVAIFASLFALKTNSNLLQILFACFIILVGVFYFVKTIVLIKKKNWVIFAMAWFCFTINLFFDKIYYVYIERFIVGLISFRGIYPYVKKMSIGVDIVQMRPVDFYNVPLKVKSIAESEPVVHIGDTVKQGSLIAKPSGKFGINIFSPVSGKVLNIFEKMNSYGDYSKHVLIMNDNKGDVEDLPAIESINDVSLINRLKEAGIIDTISGMPTYLKYAYVGARSYKTLIVLLDSTDPNNSINQTLTEYRMEEVVNGAKYFMNITSASTITFVFTEANYKLANKLKKHIQDTKKNYDFKIKFIPNKYPFDNPYILAKLLCKKTINQKNSFLDEGISIEYAESCYNFCRAVEFNKPLTSKVVTIDGDNIVRKGNYIIPSGTSYDKVLDFVGIQDGAVESQLIDGSILSGTAQYNRDISISLVTNTLLLTKYDVLSNKKEYPCISCGKCSSVCPVLLNPQKLDQLYLTENYDQLAKNKVHSCIKCGCCSYVCPAKRFLTQRIATAQYVDKKNRGAE